MKNNFNLRTFLSENKLTINSKLLKEADFAPSPNSDVMDANAEEYDIATAFKKARVDMSKPVTVIHAYGHAQYSSEDKDEMSAEAAIKKIEAERQDRSKQYTDDGEEVPEDHHSYEFENYTTFEEDMPEGHEYKLAYHQTGDADYVVTQEKSEVSEAENELKKAGYTSMPGMLAYEGSKEFEKAHDNGEITPAEYLKDVLSGMKELEHLDQESVIILKAIGRQDLIK